MARATRTLRPDMAAQAYDRLRELIVLGRLSPGSRIVENDVAERLRMSRTPVRGALQQLVREGYVIRGGGEKRARLAVAPLTADDGEELFQLVGELEGMAARLAAEEPRGARLTIASRMREANQRLRQEAASPDPDARSMFELHTQFHLAYVRGAAGPRLLNLHAAVTPQAERYRRFYSHALGNNVQPLLDEHDLIIDGIETGNPEGAAASARANWHNAGGRLRRIIETSGERGAW
jgi:DNA-binding GntR family transcriptional regulator